MKNCTKIGRNMGTNYYIYSKNREFVKEYFPDDEYSIVDEPDFGYWIHIGKTSMGWKPIFRYHKWAYKSIREMIDFFKQHNNDITVYNEYGERVYDIDPIIHYADGYPREKCIWGKDNIFGGYDVVRAPENYTGKDYIYTPFSHKEYENFTNRYRGYTYRSNVITDDDGYEFLDTWFE